jgi:two-component system cell cycle response regulator
MNGRIKYPTLLVITDSPLVRFWVKKVLDEQFFILDASKKEKALESVRLSPLDFIILDSQLEDCNPLELCREIRQFIAKTQTPIFLITGRLNKDYRAKAAAVGVTDFLTDQMDTDELLHLISIGKKTAVAKEKTADLSSFIPKPGAQGGSLKNKVTLETQALRLLSNAKLQGAPVSLLFLRIDRFSADMLPAFNQFLSRSMSQKDLIIPSSEGQFAILLPDTTMEAAKKIAESLQTQRHALPSSFSLAISSLDASEQSFHKMVEAAGKALKQASSNVILSLDKDHP